MSVEKGLLFCKGPQSRKLYVACCCIIPFLKTFGCIIKADTTSYESVHRTMTVGVWQKLVKDTIQ